MLSIAIYLALVFVLGIVLAKTAPRCETDLEKPEDF